MRRRLHDTTLDPPLPLGPGERPFTAEQAVAVTRRDGPLLLAANAGSGKTTVLAERFVRAVLEDGIAPGRLLAITFTEKAAGELRGRLRERLSELGERQAAREMEAAWVSTIHGFCARVLRSHAVAAGIDPAFGVLDEPAARAARAEAWDGALAAFLAPAENGGPRSAALDVVASYGPDRLFDTIAGVHDELRSRGQRVPRLPPAQARTTVAAAREALRRAQAAAAAELGAATGNGKTLVAAREALARCAELLDGDDAARPGRGDLGTLGFGRQAAALKTETCDAYRDALAALAAAHDDAEAVGTVALLGELLALFAERYAAAKRARSALDYDDLELDVDALFRSAPAVADAYAERFTRIMVDEFQDTNPLQLAILARLDRGNVFLVGDELQSIYGFRHADVEVFRGRRRAHEAEGAAATLATNWRSHPELLGTINAAFGDAHGGYVPLRPGRADAAAPEPRTELLVVASAWDDEGLDEVLRAKVAEGMPAAKASRQAEARAIARRVRELVESERRAPGEVAVLLRAATDLHVFERALELEGLPTLASGGRGFWLRQPVQDLCAYLAALANPRDGLALYGLLASPLAGVSSDGLAILAHAARAAGRAPWDVLAAAFCGEGEPCDLLAELPPGDRDRLAAFCPRFAAERERAPRYALDELIARVVAASGYDLHVLRLPGGRRRLANVHKLERLAAAFEAARGRDVRGFVDHATAELEADAREPEAPIDPGDRSAVSLMTIHAAKGLEFPVVVLADLGRQGNASLPDVLVDGERVGLRLVRMDGENANALAYEELKGAAYERAELEERRVFHVALTRAEERLVLSGVVSLGEDWKAPGPQAPPLAYLGPRLGADLPHRLAEAPVVDVDEQRPLGRLRLRATRVAPGDAAARLGIDTDGQLALTLDGGLAPEGAKRRARAARAPEPAAAAAATAGPTSPAGVHAAFAPPPPATLSYSALAEHDRCGYRFYLQRILRLPREADDPLARGAEAAPAGLDPRVRGSIVHSLLETLDFTLAGAAALPADEELDALAERHGATEPLTGEERDDLRALVAAFVDHPLHARLAAAAAAGALRREHGFAFPLGDEVLLNGFVDVRARDADGAALVLDYKTDRLAPDADLEALVERDYGAQRRIYALAELRARAPRVDVVHLFLERPDAPVIVSYAAADAPGLEAELRARAGAVLEGRYPVAAEPHAALCQGCPGRGSLCSYPREATERLAPGGAAA